MPVDECGSASVIREFRVLFAVAGDRVPYATLTGCAPGVGWFLFETTEFDRRPEGRDSQRTLGRLMASHGTSVEASFVPRTVDRQVPLGKHWALALAF